MTGATLDPSVAALILFGILFTLMVLRVPPNPHRQRHGRQVTLRETNFEANVGRWQPKPQLRTHSPPAAIDRGLF